MLGLLGRDKAGTAKYHHRVVDALRAQFQIWLEHFELKAYGAGLAAAEELGVGKGEAVGIARHRDVFCGALAEQIPVMRHDLFIELGIGVHGVSL
ncbi:hypothetical protein D3C72_1525270 [compost metagenome]